MYVLVCVCVYICMWAAKKSRWLLHSFLHFKVGGLCLARATPPAAFVLADGSRRRWLISSSANLRHSSSLSFSFFFSLQGTFQRSLVNNKNKTKRQIHRDLLLSLSLIGGCQLVEQFRVHLHKGFENIVDKSDNRLIPVLLANAIEGWEHDWHYGRTVLFY